MTSSLPLRPVRAALAAALALLASACVPAGMYGPRLPDIGPRTELAPATWTAESSAGEIAQWMLAGCRRAEAGKLVCVERTINGLIDQAGVFKSMQVLDTLVAADADVRVNSHALAHGLGIAAYRSPETVAGTFASCTPSLMSGCYHGVIQGYFLAQTAGGREVGPEQVEALCGPHRDKMFLYFQCAHGMGHGVMALHGGHLPTALEACDVATDDFVRENCYGGAFMENVVSVTHPHHTAEGHAGTQAHGQPAAGDAHAGHGQAASGDAHAGHGQAAAGDAHAGHGQAAGGHAAMNHGEWKKLDRDDPLYPCNVVAEKYRSSCYTMQTSAILHFNTGDVDATARACASVPEAHRSTCFMSLGRDITAVAQHDHRRSAELCGRAGELAEGLGKVWCHTGVAQSLINVAGDPAPGLAYCRLVPDERGKTACYLAVGQSIAVVDASTEARTARCEQAETGFALACRRGAGVEPSGTND